MACGLPIIASDVQGSEELVQHGRNGYLVPMRDAEAMAEAILLLLDNAHERRRMGQESRKIVEQTFAWESIARGYQQVYGVVSNGLTPR
jgi:glycosyltransferase involved in cell wall biosynthesis